MTNETENNDIKLKTDDLSSLKESEIFVDEEGKKHRVKKTILPHYFAAGPHGLGDPEDRTLRRLEADVIIPNRMNKHIEKFECNSEYMDLITCLRQDGAIKGLRSCKPILEVLNNCKIKYFNDLDFRSKITDIYLQERSEARRTGKTEKQRELERFREWKKQQEQK
ncbi:Cytochrome c oxidase biogenesis protein Cmc1-like family-containing protein [Strongyloides ratti]|uniref:COX assembly mitochondrial protein n=1 Tax=Strongyloides ratti TaxID=34506 RepID=A0A090KU01_STRRB|nr:Cytochrome c oxidase biogenesis protein Cmc1-like family-containing protein [Strongyloides ratti]CEF61000.1 Cytochrome c oxidase biogenesis protein Cmc1-like family-containing protein [Strongyloides ratti]